jgi:hypothetical protein
VHRRTAIVSKLRATDKTERDRPHGTALIEPAVFDSTSAHIVDFASTTAPLDGICGPSQHSSDDCRERLCTSPWTIGISSKSFVDNYRTPHTDAFTTPWTAVQRWRRIKTRQSRRSRATTAISSAKGWFHCPKRNPDF